MRLVVIFLIPIILLSNNLKNIEKKIKSNKKVLIKKEKEKKTTKKKLEFLANVIKKEEQDLDKLNKEIEVISNDILLNKFKLQRSKKELNYLKQKEKELSEKINKLQQKIISLIITQYSEILNKKYLKKESFDDIIKEEILQKVINKLKDNITFSKISYLASLNEQRKNKQKQLILQKYIDEQMQKKEKLSNLLKKQEDKLAKLNKSYKEYQKKLEQIIDSQYQINNILKRLKIVKTKEILKAKEKELKQQQIKKKLIKIKKKYKNYKEIKIARKKAFEEKIDLKVRNLGDSTKGIKISRFRGRKTIAPLKSYKIVRGFGTYYDPVYKIKLFNDGLTLKSRIKNAKVYAVMNGKVVYAKQNAGILGNIVIIKHSGNLHTIYSHLDKISPTIKKGKWVKKGYVIGRVKEKLFFQVTRNNSYINPLELIK